MSQPTGSARRCSHRKRAAHDNVLRLERYLEQQEFDELCEWLKTFPVDVQELQPEALNSGTSLLSLKLSCNRIDDSGANMLALALNETAERCFHVGIRPVGLRPPA